MCGKKSNPREGGQQQPRKQFLDSSLFYHEYLNNSLNYILSGSNDLDHSIQFDLPALRQILSSDVTEQSVHFVERVKQMKTRCEASSYLKDVQEYGQFINYEISRSGNQEIGGIEGELREEFGIGLKLKRIKKRFKRTDDKLTLCQIETLDKQIKKDILAAIVEQFQNKQPETDRQLDDNRLYREMFNLQEIVKKEERTEKADKVEAKKEKKKGPRRTKTIDQYTPNNINVKNKEAGKNLIDEKVKKEQNYEKSAIRVFQTHLPSPAFQNIPQTVPPSSSQVITQNNLPTSNHSQMQAENEAKQEQARSFKPSDLIQKLARQQPNPNSNLTSSAEPNYKSDPQRKKRKEKKIQKQDKEEKVRKPRGPKPKSDHQQPKQKRAYNKKPANKQQETKSLPQPSQFSAPQILPSKNISVNSIGIQADGSEDLQNLKVIAPRVPTFTFQPMFPQAPPTPAPQRKQPVVQRKQSQSNQLNRSNLLSSSREIPQSQRTEPRNEQIPNEIRSEVRQAPVARPNPPGLDSLRKGSEAQERKQQDFDISEYLI